MAGCGAIDQCGNGECCGVNGCCGGVCCAGSGVHCCGNVCCKTSEFCCSDSGTCCSADSDACGILVGGASSNATLSATCTRTAAMLANSTITIPVLVGGSSPTAETTGSSGAAGSATSASSGFSYTPSSTPAPSGDASDTTNSSNNGGDHISAGVIVGTVIGVLAALLLVAGVWIIWRRKQQSKKAQPDPYKPPGGRYELRTEKADASRHRPEVEGNEVREMEVPPTEIDGAGPAVYELPAESRPVEMGY